MLLSKVNGEFRGPTALLILISGVILLTYYVQCFSPDLDSEHSNEVEEKHLVEKRAVRRTIIKITKKTKSRQLIVKCCGKRRCLQAGNGSREKKRNTLSPKRKGTTKFETGANGTAAIVGGSSTTGGTPKADKDQAEVAGETSGPDEVTASRAKTEDKPAGDGVTAGESIKPEDGKADGGSTVATGSTRVGPEEEKTPAPTSSAPGSILTSSPGATGSENSTATTENSSQPPSNATPDAASTRGKENGSTPSTSTSTTSITLTAEANNNSISTNAATNSASTNATNSASTTINITTTEYSTTVKSSPCDDMKSNYTLSTDKLSWAKARLECKKKGMDLANLESLEENKCVKYLIEKELKMATKFWQALNKIGYSDYIEWISGKALTYNDWGTGEPAAFATENCVGIEKGHWVDADCLEANNYVCETPQPVDICKDYPVYVVSADKQNFDNARAECKKKGMDLVSVETREENVCIERQLAMDELTTEEIWMGLTKTGGANYSAWLNGKPLVYTDWDAGNPAQYAAENCVMFNKNHWHDSGCSSALKYICESTVVVDPCQNMTNKNVTSTEAAVVEDPCKGLPSTYTVSTDTLNWGAARAACKKQSADLVSIETEQENKCVNYKIQLAGKTASIVLMALNKMGLKDYSQWLTGEKITFSGWNAGEPAQLSTENCGAFQNGKWIDTACMDASAYVCESPAPQDVCKSSRNNFSLC